jgi:hypothetical protein
MLQFVACCAEFKYGKKRVEIVDFVLLLSTRIYYIVIFNRFQPAATCFCWLELFYVLKKFIRSESYEINSKLRNLRLMQQL